MAYVKNKWKDKVVDPDGQIVQEGTPLSADNLNNIENGIQGIYEHNTQNENIVSNSIMQLKDLNCLWLPYLSRYKYNIKKLDFDITVPESTGVREIIHSFPDDGKFRYLIECSGYNYSTSLVKFFINESEKYYIYSKHSTSAYKGNLSSYNALFIDKRFNFFDINGVLKWIDEKNNFFIYQTSLNSIRCVYERKDSTSDFTTNNFIYYLELDKELII